MISRALISIRWAEHVARMGKEECIQDFGVKARRKEPVRRLRRRLENNIKMDFRETEWRGMDWINLAQDRDQ
jgi:hypothetical protein